MKPKDLKIKKIKTTRVNDYQINKLEIDLAHINYGLAKSKGYRKKKRSSFTADDIADFFHSLDGIELEFNSDDRYDYFVVERNYFSASQRHRMVFSIERGKSSTSGIITLFQMKREVT